ncbi:MAG: hypothetical protein J6A84_04455 [Clostridia bacterium]|nr:hypothetical protein [Clostridia bacterium]
MTEETKFPTMKPRRSALKRQRLAVLILLGVVAVLAVAFALVWRFTSRILVEYPNGDNVVDADGTKYYAVQKDDVWVMINKHGDVCQTTEDGLYKTKDGTLVSIDQTDGTPTVVAAVLLNGTEDAMFDASDGSYDILLYPMLNRSDIQSIEIKNKKDHFTVEKQSDGSFALKGYPTASISDVMLSTLVIITGYTRTMARLDLSPENPDAEGFRQNGYAEYGLPQDPANAESYFIITAADGTAHKVIIGNIILDDTGYYARYSDRGDVYVMQQMEASQFNSTLSGTLLCAKEDYVTPTISTSLGDTTFFDVTDFTVYQSNSKGDLPELSDFEDSFKQLVKFSYSPIEQRKGTYYEHIPFIGQEKFKGYAINDTRANTCLMSLMGMVPGKTVKLYADDGETDDNLTDFIKNHGLGFAIEFTYNAERAGAAGGYKPTKTIPQRIYISPMKTEDGKEFYYMFNDMFDMTIMMERRYMEFLEWNDFKWVEDGIFEANINFLKELNISIKNGTSFGATEENKGLSGVTSVSFGSYCVDKDGNAIASNSNNSDIKVFYDYVQNGNTVGNNDPFADIAKFRKFYQTLTETELYGSMPSDTEARQEELKNSAPDLEISMTFDMGEGKTETKVYRFYFYEAGERGCYLTINGNGSFYLQQKRVDKIIRDVGRVLDPTAVIEPTAKN